MPLAPLLNQAQNRWWRSVESIVKLYFTVKGYSVSFILQSSYGVQNILKRLIAAFTVQDTYGQVKTLKNKITSFVIKLKK